MGLSVSQFHTSPVTEKSVKEKVTEVADKVCPFQFAMAQGDFREEWWLTGDNLVSLGQVNMGVGKGLASAIDKGEQVTKATKETLGQ